MDPDTYTPTGHEDLDALLSGGGLRRSHLTCVTGPVSVGKTMFTLGIARHAAIRVGHPALFASTETGPHQLMEYVMCAEATVRFGTSRPGRATNDEMDRARRLRDTITGASLGMENVINWSVDRLRSTALRLVEERGLRLLVVDYVQLLDHPDPEQSAADRIEEIAIGLKGIARAADIAVIAVSTMRSYAAKAGGWIHPAMFDLGDTEAFEYHADELLILHREDQEDRESPRAGEADVIVAKNRNGQTGTVTVAFQPHFARFIDMVQS